MDGHWKAIYDTDEFLPRRALEWMVGYHKWNHWADDWGSCCIPRAPAGYRYWFELFHDGTGLGLRFCYPQDVALGENITVLAFGAIRTGRREIPWVHGQPGLVEDGLREVIQEMAVRHAVHALPEAMDYQPAS